MAPPGLGPDLSSRGSALAAARERRARWIGAAVALTTAALLYSLIAWPAPAIAGSCGLGAYWRMRR